MSKYLSLVLRLVCELSPCLDLWSQEGLGEVSDSQPQQLADLLGDSVVWEKGLVRPALLLELQVAKVKHC